MAIENLSPNVSMQVLGIRQEVNCHECPLSTFQLPHVWIVTIGMPCVWIFVASCVDLGSRGALCVMSCACA